MMLPIGDTSILKCRNYETYLKTFITTPDRFYLRNERACEMLVSLNYRSTTVYTRNQFAKYKQQLKNELYKRFDQISRFCYHHTSGDPVLVQLALREEPNRQKTLSTIIYVNIRGRDGFDISGFIDYEQSLRTSSTSANWVDWKSIFQERIHLYPTPSDLSYYNWKSGVVFYNSSDNYNTLHDAESGLTFIHRGDHKKICITKKSQLHYHRSIFSSEKLGNFIFYDYIIRKKI